MNPAGPGEFARTTLPDRASEQPRDVTDTNIGEFTSTSRWAGRCEPVSVCGKRCLKFLSAGKRCLKFLSASGGEPVVAQAEGTASRMREEHRTWMDAASARP